MSLKNLLYNLQREGKLKAQDTNIDYLNNLLTAAKRNFEAATLSKGMTAFTTLEVLLARPRQRQFSRLLRNFGGGREFI